MPQIPTRPLSHGSFFSSHSIVSQVSLDSSTSFGPLGRVVRPHVHELALGHVAAPHVLVGEDEALLRRRLGGAHALAVGVAPVGRDAVGRPGQQDRVALVRSRVLGDVDGREELHPVPHRDAVLVLGVARANGVRALGAGRGRGGDRAAEAATRDDARAGLRVEASDPPAAGTRRTAGAGPGGQRAAGAPRHAEEAVDRRLEALGLLDRGEVAALLEDHEPRVREAVGQLLHPRGRQHVVGPGDHEGPHRDRGQLVPRVEGGRSPCSRTRRAAS